MSSRLNFDPDIAEAKSSYVENTIDWALFFFSLSVALNIFHIYAPGLFQTLSM